MKKSLKYVAIVAIFLVGVGSAVAYQTHAQTPVAQPATTSTVSASPAPTNSADTDVETNDDAVGASSSVHAASATQESEADSSDVNEVEDGN